MSNVIPFPRKQATATASAEFETIRPRLQMMWEAMHPDDRANWLWALSAHARGSLILRQMPAFDLDD